MQCYLGISMAMITAMCPGKADGCAGIVQVARDLMMVPAREKGVGVEGGMQRAESGKLEDAPAS